MIQMDLMLGALKVKKKGRVRLVLFDCTKNKVRNNLCTVF